MKERVSARVASVAKFISVFGQSLLSLSFNIGALLAGTLLAISLDIFSLAPWTLVLFPGILTVRGAIGGLFSGRLGTSLHLGTIRDSYTKNTRHFNLLLHVLVALAFISSIVMGLTTWFFGIFLWGATVADSLNILAVTTAAMGLSLVPISPITIAVSVFSFKHGLDPDVIVYPVISTIADVIVTACYILCLTLFFTSTFYGYFVIGLVNVIFLSTAFFITLKNIKEKEFIKTIREFLLTLLFVTFIVNITGLLLNKVRDTIGVQQEIYVVYPALIDTTGAVGSIIGSISTTKLALGLVTPSLSAIKQHLTEICSAWAASVIMFALYSVVSSFAYGKRGLSNLSVMVMRLLATNVLAVFVIILIAYLIAVATHRRGWDPDNFVIPIESALADGVTTAALLTALVII